jgi:hypothetical protein
LRSGSSLDHLVATCTFDESDVTSGWLPWSFHWMRSDRPLARGLSGEGARRDRDGADCRDRDADASDVDADLVGHDAMAGTVAARVSRKPPSRPELPGDRFTDER